MGQLYKFVCVEALASKDGKFAACLVSENGHYVGVMPRDRKELPERVKLEHWRVDQPPLVDLRERFVPAKQIRRLSLDIQRNIKKKMLKVHLPPNAKDKNAVPWVLAENFADAMKKFGIKEAKAPTKKQVADAKKDRDAEKKADRPSAPKVSDK